MCGEHGLYVFMCLVLHCASHKMRSECAHIPIDLVFQMGLLLKSNFLGGTICQVLPVQYLRLRNELILKGNNIVSNSVALTQQITEVKNKVGGSSYICKEWVYLDPVQINCIKKTFGGRQLEI